VRRLNQQIEDRVQRHATSQLAKNMLKNAHPGNNGGWALLAQAEAIFADLAFLRSGELEVCASDDPHGVGGVGGVVVAGFYDVCVLDVCAPIVSLALT
jgi:hypothetical protein